jgi:ATP-dependent Clp protease ATP-binding subunit ClpA
VLEDGRLTDNKGRTIDFANTMLILTSNVGSRRILQMANAPAGLSGDAAYSSMRSAVKAELGSAFRPEFLNRLDEVRTHHGRSSQLDAMGARPSWAWLG